MSRQPTETAPYINITPLIDILLVLLIIFMVISPLKPARFEAKLPSEPDFNDQDILPNPNALVVTIDKNLNLKLNRQGDLGTIADMGKLSAELAKTFQFRRENQIYKQDWKSEAGADENIEKTVFIRAPRSIGYGEIAKVIDGVKGAGAAPIGLQIDDLEQ